MKTIGLIITLLQIYNTFSSYYTNGHTKLDADVVTKVITKYDKMSLVEDRNHSFSKIEIEQNKYHWLCGDGSGNLCSYCKPIGNQQCKGVKDSLTYNTLYGDNPLSICTCVLMKHGIFPSFILYTNDGRDHYWNQMELIYTPPKQEQLPLIMRNEEYNCSIIETEILRAKCNVEQDSNYITENYDYLLKFTYYLLNMDPDLWKVHVDRSHGILTFFYEYLNTTYTFSNNLEYELIFTDIYNLEKFNSSDLVRFEIPNEVFWRNISLTWKVSTNEQWYFGKFLLKNGTIQWNANIRPNDEISYDECTKKCGAFCFRNIHCMTDIQKKIKMGGIIMFILTCWLALLSSMYIWSDQRVKVKSTGSNSKCVKTLLCVSVISLAIPYADAWGTCTASAFTQSKLKVHTSGKDHIIWSGNMYLSNIKGSSCFDIQSPDNVEEVVLKAILEVEKAELVYQLIPQYSTFSYYVPSPKIDLTCPPLVCVDCEGICLDDRTCKKTIDINTNLLGKSECIDHYPVDNDCVSLYFGFTCKRMRKIVGYVMQPKEWYVVSKLNPNPALNVHVKMTLDYLNGTTQVEQHVINSLSPNMIAPEFKIGDTEFYNNGISQTSTKPEKEYVMIHIGNTNDNHYPVTTNHAYFVNAEPVGIKVNGKIGSIQCRVIERDQCDAPDNICTMDLIKTKDEVSCGIDPVASATYAQDTELPLNLNGITYKLSSDLSTMSAQLSDIGSLNLFMNGITELASETVIVVPQCSLIGVANGCFMCTTGFWFKVLAMSTLDSGKAIISISHADESDDKNIGIFNKIITLTNENQEFDIHGYTEKEINSLIVRISAGENYCEFPLGFNAHFDDKTAISNRSKVYLTEDDTSSHSFNLSSLGNFFSHMLGGLFSWGLPIAGILLTLPLISPLLSGSLRSVSGITGGFFKDRLQYSQIPQNFSINVNTKQ